MKSETRTVAVINNSKILMIQNGQKLVPIKPICEALGIVPDTQKRKIESDEILGSVATLSVATGADGKQYEMFCLPFKFVFGWLFTINPANVKEEAKESVKTYKLACYEALYQSFTDSQEFLEAKQALVEEKLSELEAITENFKSTRNMMYDKKKELNKVRNLTLDDWVANNRQITLFDEPNTEE